MIRVLIWNEYEHGKIFYFQPGHEEYRTYDNPHIRRILLNSIRWAAPLVRLSSPPDNIEVK